MPRGYNAHADIMRRTADGRDLNELFAEFQQVAALANETQQSFIGLLTYPTESPVVSVLQTLGSDSAFEEASEYGSPTSKRSRLDVLNMGAGFKWYDNRWASTWRYLADATSTEIEANVAAIVAADQDLVFKKVMETVFRNTNRSVTDPKTNSVYDVFAFANGDGWTPPAYEGNTFDSSHTHYRISGAGTIDSGDLDDIVSDFKSHGYSEENGSQIVIMVNTQEADVISTFRVASGAKADFVPATGARFYSSDQLLGTQAPATFAGLTVKGSYDEAFIIESSRIPAGYVVALASGGEMVPSNPIMFREHASIKGLTLVQGNRQDYPLTDSYWVRGFGTGVRHRLAGMVMQIKASGSYAPPSLYVA